MYYFMNSSHDFTTISSELRVCPEQVLQLITPAASFKNRGERFAIDNGAFSGFDPKGFVRLLEREKVNRASCIFVVVPDVVCSARRTLEVFEYWYPRLCGWPLALACQNGQEDLPIPWELIEAVFIGGDDNWKVSHAARDIVKAAKAIGKWAHVGRVNTPVRLEVVESWGTDSIDGMGLALYSHMREKIAAYRSHPKLEWEDA